MHSLWTVKGKIKAHGQGGITGCQRGASQTAGGGITGCKGLTALRLG